MLRKKKLRSYKNRYKKTRHIEWRVFLICLRALLSLLSCLLATLLWSCCWSCCLLATLWSCLLSCCLLALLWSSLLCCCLLALLWSSLLSCCLLAALWSCLLCSWLSCLLALLWSSLLCCCLLAALLWCCCYCSCLLTALLWCSWCCCLLALLWCCFLCCGHVLLLSEWFGSVTQTCSWISVTSIGQKCQHFVTNNLARVANLYFYFFMHLRKFHYFLFLQIVNFQKICKNPSILCQVRKSRPLIEGLRVIFPPFSDFRGHICCFGCRIF
jgi:hypothetical protein